VPHESTGNLEIKIKIKKGVYMKICVLERGWVMVGQLEKDGEIYFGKWKSDSSMGNNPRSWGISNKRTSFRNKTRTYPIGEI